MNTITAEVRDNALVLPPDVIAQLGWREDTKILIKRDNGSLLLRSQEITAEEIEKIACTYLIDRVGDATAVKTPLLKDGRWHVEVVLSYRPQTVGFLTFSLDGRLVESESDSPVKMQASVK